jgi:predicted DNA-binding helix-hairpin-helix protein
MSSKCQNDCKFCAFRAERRTVRENWQPEQLARVTMKVWRSGRIRGLFLSSSVENDADQTVEKEIETTELLRKQGFNAYVHLRLMPSVSRELIKRSVEIADRVGINIEFPSREHYNDMKIFLDFRQDLIKRIKWLAKEIKKVKGQEKCKAGLDSQMVVGASDETDKEILQISDWLYHKLKARRVYYSAFDPIANTPLENKKATDRWREYRLYQCSFLLHKYGYHSKEFVFEDEMLPVRQDPKFSIARQKELRVDPNAASFDELIKIPGVGLETAEKILQNRPIKDFKQLHKLGVLKRAVTFLDVKKEIQTNLKFFNT